jgi:hypothetical protein
MTRQDTIAHITTQLAALDDRGVQAVADIVAGLAASAQPIRALTGR